MAGNLHRHYFGCIGPNQVSDCRSRKIVEELSGYAAGNASRIPATAKIFDPVGSGFVMERKSDFPRNPFRTLLSFSIAI